ncbi:MAG: glycerol-3-phosphate dehydrogenase subunit GlpB [Desulfobacterales bacterium]|nr:glycerol-3-phosphate dehydrogenase subunit GlpB [Desulfobacterales bacterium]MCF8078424.1 glycerol-3-phosphate dehydrogenase subunit GlpB [Desulfobacterales bacterium]
METRFEMAVIGTGMAGLAAALFAARQGVAAAVVGSSAEIIFASGFFDVLGVHPIEQRRIRINPWKGIEALVRDNPKHPYAKISQKNIAESLETVIAFLQKTGLSYCRRSNRNAMAVTPAGTLKPTYAMPRSMWNGVLAWEEKAPCLIVGLEGLKGFSARMIAENLRQKWPGLRPVKVSFPDSGPGAELFAERLARRLESSSIRKSFAAAVRRRLGAARAVGMPAVFGLYRPEEVFADLQARIGVPIFEIPTMPPSIPGLRIKDAFLRELPKLGVRVFAEKKVLAARHEPGRGFVLDIGAEAAEAVVCSDAVILASGRFLGRGLRAERTRIIEAVFDLPVYQVSDRASWHREELLDARGHPIHRAGVEIDDWFRPLAGSGRPAYDRLFAAGSILAHQDWMREKCGSGLAVASAQAAVNAYLNLKKSPAQ